MIIRSSFGSPQRSGRRRPPTLGGNGYTGVHICDQNSQIFGLIPSINSSSCGSRAPSRPTRRQARGPSVAETRRRKFAPDEVKARPFIARVQPPVPLRGAAEAAGAAPAARAAPGSRRSDGPRSSNRFRPSHRSVAGGDRFRLTVLGVGERVVARVNRSVSVHADQLISKLNGGLRQRLERTHEVSLH